MKISTIYIIKGFRHLKFVFILLTLISWVFMIGCSDDGGGPDPEPNPQAEVLLKLSGSWTVSSITRNGVDVTGDYAGFTLTLTSTTFSTTNGTGAWEPSGTWTWNDPEGTSILLSNGVIVQLDFSNNDSTLTCSFTLPETIINIGRTKALAGNYVFVLNK